MNTKALRQKILDLAIHGKLVPQDPNDEPASVLLQRIKAEKERLIKEGKIKRAKKSKATCDKPHYPYQLPEGWEWCKLEDLAYSITDGDHQAPPKVSNGIPFLVISDVTSENIDFSNTRYVSQDYYDAIQFHRKPKCGDILFTVTGSYGIVVKVSTDKQFCFQRHIGLIKPIVDNDYLVYVLRSQYVKKLCDDLSTGTAQKTVGLDTLRYFMIPIPPLQEQSRIVKSIEHWLSLVDCIEENKNNLQKAIKQAKSKILDLAIHGKLVPQDPTDEPASELLKRINPKAEIACDNGHYQKLPEGWCECKLSDVCVFDNGYAFSSDNYNNCGIPLIRISNITNTGSIDLSSCVFIQDVPSNKFIVKSGDLLIAMSGATTGKMGVYLYEENALLNQRVGNLKCTDAMLQQYRNYYMFAKSDYILKIAYGGAQPNISAKAILDIDVMLPPLKEQHRIVAKIEEIFAQLDAIEASL